MKTSRFFPILVLCVLSGCVTSPTGRKQLMLLPDSQMNTLGGQSFGQLKSQTPIENDPAINAYVKCIAMAVAREAQEQSSVKDWEVVVFKDPSANAFALPGGKIGVHTGMLSVAKTQHQLAAVLGHEVGHVIARHGNERVSQNMAAGGVLGAIDSLAKNSPNHGLLMGSLGIGTQLGVLLPYSRSHESEADKIGVDLMARAGFDPRESVQLWKNMKEASGGKSPPQITSTHPSNDTRIAALEAEIPAASASWERAKAAGKNPTCRL